MAEGRARFDPLGMLATLDRHRVAYIVIGSFGRVIQGAEEITRGVDIVPSMKGRIFTGSHRRCVTLPQSART